MSETEREREPRSRLISLYLGQISRRAAAARGRVAVSDFLKGLHSAWGDISMSHSRQAPAAHTTGSALPHHRFNGGRLAVYKKRPLSAVLHHLVNPLRPCAPRGSSYTSCGCGRGESDAHTHSWCTGDERGTVRCLARPESSLPRHKAKGPQQPLMPAEGGDRCPHEPRRRGLDQCGNRAREEQPAAGGGGGGSGGQPRTSREQPSRHRATGSAKCEHAA